MFDYINGTLASLTPTAAVIEAGGVGYLINISLQTHRTIDGAKQAKLYVHTYILQQEAQVLYGFATATEREMFRLLISVSGIGANTARIMLSTNSTDDLATMIATGNTAAIKQTKGIGIKTAERVILELKNKVLSVMALSPGERSEAGGFATESSESLQEAIAALVVLGFSRAAVDKTTRKIHAVRPDISAEDLIREALSQL